MKTTYSEITSISDDYDEENDDFLHHRDEDELSEKIYYDKLEELKTLKKLLCILIYYPTL